MQIKLPYKLSLSYEHTLYNQCLRISLSLVCLVMDWQKLKFSLLPVRETAPKHQLSMMQSLPPTSRKNCNILRPPNLKVCTDGFPITHKNCWHRISDSEGWVLNIYFSTHKVILVLVLKESRTGEGTGTPPWSTVTVHSPVFDTHPFQNDAKRLGGHMHPPGTFAPHQLVVSQLIYHNTVSFALTHLSTHTYFCFYNVHKLMCGSSNQSSALFYSIPKTYLLRVLCSLIRRSFSVLNSKALSTFPTLLLIIMVMVLCCCCFFNQIQKRWYEFTVFPKFVHITTPSITKA